MIYAHIKEGDWKGVHVPIRYLSRNMDYPLFTWILHSLVGQKVYDVYVMFYMLYTFND